MAYLFLLIEMFVSAVLEGDSSMLSMALML